MLLALQTAAAAPMADLSPRDPTPSPTATVARITQAAAAASVPASPAQARTPARRRMSICVPPSPTSAMNAMTGGGASTSSFPALEARGYRVRSHLKSSLYGAVMLADQQGIQSNRGASPSMLPLPRPALQLGPSSRRPSVESRVQVSPLPLLPSASPLPPPALHVASPPSVSLPFAQSKPLVCVKISRLWLAVQHATPDAAGRLSSVRDRVLSEGQVLRTLSACPQVAALVDEFSDAEHHYLITTFAGKELFDVVAAADTGADPNGSKLTPARVQSYALQLASGVAAMHASGVAHLDLSLSNLCVDDAGLLRIIDFGLADFGASDAVGRADSTTAQVNVKTDSDAALLAHSRVPSALGDITPNVSPSASSMRSPVLDLSALRLASPCLGPQMLSSPLVQRPTLHQATTSPFGSPSLSAASTVGSSLLHSASPGERSAFSPLSPYSATSTSSSASSSASSTLLSYHPYASPPGVRSMSRRGSTPNTHMQQSSVLEEGEQQSCGDSPFAFELGHAALPDTPFQTRTIHVRLPVTPISAPLTTVPCHTTVSKKSDNSNNGIPQAQPPAQAAHFHSSVGDRRRCSRVYTWPASHARRLRTDLPPSKHNYQSREQRACTLFHTSPLLSPTSADGSPLPPPTWCPFAADVYAIGACLYELVTGQRFNHALFEQHDEAHSPTDGMCADGDSPSSPIRAVVDGDDKPSSLPPPPSVDPQLWHLILQCTRSELHRPTAAALLHHPFLRSPLDPNAMLVH